VIARPVPRTVYAAALLTVSLALVLGAWFVSGWRDVRSRQRELAELPRAAAEQRTVELAGIVRSDLEELVVRETRRPYFQYQNLMHDPKASAGLNVTPSPLAAGSEDERVLGYFQIDAAGRTSTPTINDDVPALSERERLPEHQVFRQRVRQDLSPQLVAAGAIGSPHRTAAKRTQNPPQPEPVVEAVERPPVATQQMVQLDPRAYAQNAAPNQVFASQQAPFLRLPGASQPPPTPPAVVESPDPVTITISPLEWRTMSYAGTQTLVALRQVQTPDGTLTQGFVVDRPALTKWVAARAAGMVTELHAADGQGTAVAPGWGLRVLADPRVVAQALEESSTVERVFLLRFVGTGGAAVLAAAVVLFFLMRAEQLARERSQFAAAAAHELRTPLAGLQLYGEMLGDGLGDAGKARDYARRVSEDAARLGRVVSNMLGFSQLERGSLSVDASEGPLGEALRDIAERATPELTRAGASIQVEVAPELRGRVDRDALTRIVGNLLDNAEKYTRTADDRTIQLSARDQGDSVEIQIADRGPGVSDPRRLFRPFWRGTKSGDGPPGLGLGLVLSKSLARAMGGDLTYAPRRSGGSTFILRVPRK
jgi:signal transduction histidine kinase